MCTFGISLFMTQIAFSYWNEKFWTTSLGSLIELKCFKKFSNYFSEKSIQVENLLLIVINLRNISRKKKNTFFMYNNLKKSWFSTIATTQFKLKRSQLNKNIWYLELIQPENWRKIKKKERKYTKPKPKPRWHTKKLA